MENTHTDYYILKIYFDKTVIGGTGVISEYKKKIKEIQKDVAGGAITDAIGNFNNLNADKFKNPNEPDKEIGLEAKTTVDNAKKWVDASDGYATYEEPNPQT